MIDGIYHYFMPWSHAPFLMYRVWYKKKNPICLPISVIKCRLWYTIDSGIGVWETRRPYYSNSLRKIVSAVLFYKMESVEPLLNSSAVNSGRSAALNRKCSFIIDKRNISPVQPLLSNGAQAELHISFRLLHFKPSVVSARFFFFIQPIRALFDKLNENERSGWPFHQICGIDSGIVCWKCKNE